MAVYICKKIQLTLKLDYQIVEDVGLSRSRSWEVALIIFDCFMRCGYLRDSTYISCKEGEFINTLFKIWCQISYWTDFLFRRIIIVGFEGKVNTNIVVECFKRIRFWALHRKDKWIVFLVCRCPKMFNQDKSDPSRNFNKHLVCGKTPRCFSSSQS